MPIALDGTPQGRAEPSETSLTLPAFTTANGNVIVYAAIVTDTPVLSISGGGLTWAVRYSGQLGGLLYTSLWYAKSVSAISSVQFDVTQTSAGNLAATVFAFTGAKFSSPFDPNLPNATTASEPMSWITSNANDCLVASSGTGDGGVTVDPPFTSIRVSNELPVAGYRLVTAIQDDSSATWSGGNKRAIADALVEGQQSAVSRSMPMAGSG